MSRADNRTRGIRWWANPVARLPIRLRLTLAFALAMAVILAAVGFFLYAGLGSALNAAIDGNLRTRVDDIAALLQQSDTGLQEGGGTRLAAGDGSFAQVINSSGSVIDSTPQAGTEALLTSTELRRAVQGVLTLERASVPGREGQARLLAASVHAQDQDLVVVVGASLESRSEALSTLLIQLGIGMPIALLAAAVLAYALASAAFRPVESMRAQAEAISATQPGRRLPVSVARDELARLSVTLNDMLARLELALAREQAFVSDASHELRTPLALLKGELDLALSRARSPKEMEDALRYAAKDADRLVQLTEDLLVLARADQGKLPVRPSPLCVQDVLEGVLERFNRRAADAGTTLEVKGAAGLRLTGDRLRLEQALANLVENALRYGKGPVLLTAFKEGDFVELHVLDRGPGFRADFLPRAFERFTRADESRGAGGAGLGLSIAEIIARAHGGAAYAANRDRGGADVWLSLPLETAALHTTGPAT